MPRRSWGPIINRAAVIVASFATAVTLRQLHYRLVSIPELGYRNNENDYKYLSKLTASLRRENAFPALLDTTRRIEQPLLFDGPADALRWLADEYRLDLLRTHDTVPVIVVEKATLVEQLDAWFGSFPVPIVPLRGYSSESFEREVVALARRVEQQGRQVEFLYGGDFDSTGEDIPRAFENNIGLELRRVALTAAQVEHYGLPVEPGKTTDARAAAFLLRHGRLVQVELEALNPNDLRGLFASAIEPMIDHDLVERERQQQDADRGRLFELADAEEDSDAR